VVVVAGLVVSAASGPVALDLGYPVRLLAVLVVAGPGFVLHLVALALVPVVLVPGYPARPVALVVVDLVGSGCFLVHPVVLAPALVFLVLGYLARLVALVPGFLVLVLPVSGSRLFLCPGPFFSCRFSLKFLS
jgi:hypothetical protein